MSERSQKFVDYIIQRIERSSGDAAALKRAGNPNTEYQSWEILAGFGVRLDSENERLPFATIAADIACVHPTCNGKTKISQAIALCYSDGHKSDQAKAKLRRLLACDTITEACRILRPLFSLISSKSVITLNYVDLLDQLLWYHDDDSRQLTKICWAQNFYGKYNTEFVNE
jgi:CRISPR system Cascade subunit CasB